MIDWRTLPQSPGVYLFKGTKGEVIYVGKAARLRARVASYFQKSAKSPKTEVLVRSIQDIDFIVVGSEVEALLLENKLIKQYSPKYNISLKDSKTYAYICITDEEFPRILTVRKRGKKGTYFGPYTDGFARVQLIALAVRIFQLRVCKTMPKRACLNYHIGLCSAPCIHNVSREEYLRQVEGAVRFLKGDSGWVEELLRKEMDAAAKSLQFELALEKRRQLESLEVLRQRQSVDRYREFDEDVIAFVENGVKGYVELLAVRKGVISGKKQFTFELQDDLLQSFIKTYYADTVPPQEILLSEACWADDAEKASIEQYLEELHGKNVRLGVPQRGDRLALIALAEKNALARSENKVLEEIKEKLLLPGLPVVIECFDMSNLGQEALVGGMVQWVNGKPNKAGYRRFAIKSFSGKNDDFASMREVVFRRYRQLVREKADLPDLIIVDGGRGQLESALFSLKTLGLKIPVIALAKEREEIYLPHEREPLRFNPQGEMMLLLRAIRDSVHRFVLSYNRKKRSMRVRDEMSQAS
ncbi:excinuclease ABC subunit UvrC [Candidatus Woesearchaeota archaeon]|nr:MAG: excinuclease ABC subunit UvrC [Candidatus Woesearchaeota archaeon]